MDDAKRTPAPRDGFVRPRTARIDRAADAAWSRRLRNWGEAAADVTDCS
jgi:hypothetical protein